MFRCRTKHARGSALKHWPCLQDEIADSECLEADQLDLEVGAGVAVDVAVDDGLVVGGAGPDCRAARSAGLADAVTRPVPRQLKCWLPASLELASITDRSISSTPCVKSVTMSRTPCPAIMAPRYSLGYDWLKPPTQCRYVHVTMVKLTEPTRQAVSGCRNSRVMDRQSQWRNLPTFLHWLLSTNENPRSKRLRGSGR